MPFITVMMCTTSKQNDYIKLTYMNARWYDSSIGRFISADTIVPDPANPQSYNRYSYVYNNPVNFTDPSGHCAEKGSSDSADMCWLYLEYSFCYDIDCGAEGWQRWIVVDENSIWEWQELMAIHDGLLATQEAMASINLSLIDETEGVRFYRINSD